MPTNKVSRTYAALINHGLKAQTGAQTNAAVVNLEQNDAPAIATDLYDVIGDPGTPLVPGKQAILNTRNQAVKSAYAASRLAIRAGREYCRLGVSLLKPVLGVKHNGTWQAAGFLTPSLAMPQNPSAMLIEFRHYFEANPAQENAASGITAAQAQARVAAIQSTAVAVAAAETAQLTAKRARDLAVRALQKRLSGLRYELGQLLSREDGLWREFGFHRPADGQLPEVVESVILTPGLPGTVVVTWEAASLAENYRVLWRPEGSPIEGNTEVGLFADLQVLIGGLPSGISVLVRVTSRNNSGETDPKEATITVP
jgi:hypothetical protein